MTEYKELTELEKLKAELNYVYCRIADIDFYSNSAVFQQDFKNDTNATIEPFQEKYLNIINLNNQEVEEFFCKICLWCVLMPTIIFIDIICFIFGIFSKDVRRIYIHKFYADKSEELEKFIKEQQ